MAMLDLLLQHATVLDGTNDECEADVAIRSGRIVEVRRDLPAESALRVKDCSGLLIVPGLVDVHTHIYRGVTLFGINHNAVAWRSGVTTWIDAGSAGAYSTQGFRDFIAQPSAATVKMLLNISSIGLIGAVGETADMANVDEALCRQTIAEHADLVVGLKARISGGVVGSNGILPLRAARRVSDECGVPLMVHIGHEPPSLDEVLLELRAGDILTHCCTDASMGLLDGRARIRESVWAARDRGVLFDVGHGASSYAFKVTDALAEQGFWPDLISTDIHQRNAWGPVFDLPSVMNKLLMAGMPLRDVIRATTSAPAKAFSLDAGTLRKDAPADLAVFAVEEGEFPFFDSHLEERRAGTRLTNTATYVAGRELAPVTLPDPAIWVDKSKTAAAAAAADSERRRWQDRLARATRLDFLPGPAVKSLSPIREQLSQEVQL